MPQPNSVLGHIRHVNLGDELGEESSTDPSTITRPGKEITATLFFLNSIFIMILYDNA